MLESRNHYVVYVNLDFTRNKKDGYIIYMCLLWRFDGDEKLIYIERVGTT